MEVELVESPRPDDEDAYWRKLAESSKGWEIALWWNSEPGHPPLSKLANAINKAIAEGIAKAVMEYKEKGP